MKTILSIFLTLILLSGCKTKEVIKYIPINNTVTKIDSFTVLRTDSFVQTSKGDTIYRDRWRTLFTDRIKLRVDTLKVPYEVRTPFEVEKKVIEYKHDFIWYVGLLVIISTFIFLLYKIIK
jgi:hypothetical protein